MPAVTVPAMVRVPSAWVTPWMFAAGWLQSGTTIIDAQSDDSVEHSWSQFVSYAVVYAHKASSASGSHTASSAWS